MLSLGLNNKIEFRCGGQKLKLSLQILSRVSSYVRCTDYFGWKTWKERDSVTRPDFANNAILFFPLVSLFLFSHSFFLFSQLWKFAARNHQKSFANGFAFKSFSDIFGFSNLKILSSKRYKNVGKINLKIKSFV